MQKEKQLLPHLRFPEFEGEWEMKKLGEICTMTSSKRVYLEDYVDSGIPFYRGKEITELKNKLKPTNILYITKKRYEEFKESFGIPQVGDILITAVGTLGNVWKVDNRDEFYFKDGNLIWLKNISVNEDFLEHLIQLNTNELIKTSIGSTQKALTMVELRKIKLNYPQPKEQQKIANFLTAIDTQIQTLEKKKTLLEQYKKGVVRKIFKQDLKVKDKNGKDFQKWNFVKLKEVLKRSKLKNTDEKVKYILTNSATQGIVSQNDYFDKDIANQNNLQGYYVVEIDDFIYNPRISQTAPVGPLKRNKLAQGVMSPLYTVLRPKKGNLEFLEFYFETTLWHKYMKSIANYGARHDRMNITITDFENLPIPFPSLEEQTKIANFLSAIDKNIALVNTKIEHTKAYKKGLLQQMFV